MSFGLDVRTALHDAEEGVVAFCNAECCRFSRTFWKGCGFGMVRGIRRGVGSVDVGLDDAVVMRFTIRTVPQVSSGRPLRALIRVYCHAPRLCP